MALFHLSVTQTKRSAGQSAIASAAYRAGERLYSEYYGEYSDYTRKGGVICSDILLPSHQMTNPNVRKAVLAMRKEVQKIPAFAIQSTHGTPCKGVDDSLLSRAATM